MCICNDYGCIRVCVSNGGNIIENDNNFSAAAALYVRRRVAIGSLVTVWYQQRV